MLLDSIFKKREKIIKIDYDNLRLVRPNYQYLNSFRESYREYKAHKVEDFGYYKVNTVRDVRKFLTMADELDRGTNLHKYESVRTSLFWLTDGVNYLGSGSLRHNLTDHLRVFGGNIGYCVRPPCWGMGLGTVQLHFLCVEAKKIGLKTVRLTCYQHNTASKRVMEKNGAVFVDRVVNRIKGQDRLTLIYEIDLTYL